MPMGTVLVMYAGTEMVSMSRMVSGYVMDVSKKDPLAFAVMTAELL